MLILSVEMTDYYPDNWNSFEFSRCGESFLYICYFGIDCSCQFVAYWSVFVQDEEGDDSVLSCVQFKQIWSGGNHRNEVLKFILLTLNRIFDLFDSIMIKEIVQFESIISSGKTDNPIFIVKDIILTCVFIFVEVEVDSWGTKGLGYLHFVFDVEEGTSSSIE